MTKKHWLNIIQKINNGSKVEYITLNNGDVLFSQNFYKKRVFDGVKFTGKFVERMTPYWCSVTQNSIRMNFSRKSGYYDNIFTGIHFNDIKYIKFYD